MLLPYCSAGMKETRNKDNCKRSKHGNLVPTSVGYLDFTTTECEGRLLRQRQQKLCTVVDGGKGHA